MATKETAANSSRVWAEYLKYLKRWAEEHTGSDFFGMSPACFDEWLDNECEGD